MVGVTVNESSIMSNVSEAFEGDQSDTTHASDRTTKFPLYFTSTVVKGFGRGGKDLGCPTANMFIDRSSNV